MKYFDKLKLKRAINDPINNITLFCDWYFGICKKNPSIDETNCTRALIKRIFDCLNENEARINRIIGLSEETNKATISIFFVIEFLLREHLTNDRETLEAIFEVINPEIMVYFEKNEINIINHPVLKANQDLNHLILKKMITDSDTSPSRINTYLGARSMLNGNNLLGIYIIKEVYWMVNEIIEDKNDILL
jgi:hypothetical protein